MEKLNKNLRYVLTGLILLVAGIGVILYIDSSSLGILSMVLLLINVVIFLYLAVYDIHHMEIPIVGIVVLLASAFAFRLSLSSDQLSDYLYLLLSCFFVLALFFLLSRVYKTQVFGLGDYLLVIAIAVLSTYQVFFVTLELAVIAGAFVGVITAFLEKKRINKMYIPLVPFLFIGWIMALNISDWVIDLIFWN